MKKRKIKIYTDKKYLTQDEYEPILFPFWGLSKSEKNNPYGGEFNEYIKNGKNYFEMTSIEDSDFVVLPEKYNKNKLLQYQPLIEISKKNNKPILIFFHDDSAEKINIKGSYIFRTSLYKKNKNENEFVIPGWVEDFTTKYFDKNLQIRIKHNTPIVSYCGYTKTWKDRIKAIIGKDYGIWRKLRYEAIKILRKDRLIVTNFLIRSDFWGGANKMKAWQNEERLLKFKNKIRQEYLYNMVNGDYALTARGNGNFSMRFYEIFSLGRIPLFINTDCVLPYEDQIDWKNLCVWVEDKELYNISKKLLTFHNKITNDDFQKLQIKIRKTYEQWLSPDGFFKNFYKHFQKNER